MHNYLLILTSMLLFSLESSAMNMKVGHASVQTSLVPACLDTKALPSPHCGRVPTAVYSHTAKRNGMLYVVFSQNSHIYISTSKDLGLSYSPPIAINRTPELMYDDGENRPKIVLGSKQEIYVSWTHKTNGRYSGDVRFSRSLDAGITFEAPITINSDRALISHRFDAMTLDDQGHLYIVWIDKRDKEKAEALEQAYDGSSLYYAVSHDSGSSFLANTKRIDNSCECCRIAIDTDNESKVVTLWRHVYPGNIRDHAIAYLEDSNATGQSALERQKPMRATNDQWQIEGCPHHGPDLSIDDANIAHMAWFTQGKAHKGLMYGQFDLNQNKIGLTSIIDQSSGASRPQVYVQGKSVYLMWKRFEGESMVLLLRRSNDRGKTWQADETIARTLNGADHPDWLWDGKTLFITWHTQSEGFQIIPLASSILAPQPAQAVQSISVAQ
jgi:hypothetical protein